VTIKPSVIPLEMALEGGRTVLLVGTYQSEMPESVHISAHAQETHPRSTKPRADD
jgi:hypothetical protein